MASSCAVEWGCVVFALIGPLGFYFSRSRVASFVVCNGSILLVFGCFEFDDFFFLGTWIKFG